MRKKRWARAVVLTVVWTYAVATWASISHHLFGMPDLVLPAALAAAVAVPAWALRPLVRTPAAASASSVQSALSAD